jgi:hypothetical protein
LGGVRHRNSDQFATVNALPNHVLPLAHFGASPACVTAAWCGLPPKFHFCERDFNALYRVGARDLAFCASGSHLCIT